MHCGLPAESSVDRWEKEETFSICGGYVCFAYILVGYNYK